MRAKQTSFIVVLLLLVSEPSAFADALACAAPFSRGPVVDSSYAELPYETRDAIDQLIEAEALGLRVSMHESGVFNPWIGRVSDVVVNRGRVTFRIDGQLFRPVTGFWVDVLGHHRMISSPQAIASYFNLFPAQKPAVELLLRAQAERVPVSIREWGVADEAVGRISQVRIKNKRLIFKVNGKDYEPRFEFSVRPVR